MSLQRHSQGLTEVEGHLKKGGSILWAGTHELNKKQTEKASCIRILLSPFLSLPRCKESQ